MAVMLKIRGRISFKPTPIACLQPGKRLPIGARRMNKPYGYKPASWLCYPEGHVGGTIRAGFTFVKAYCVGHQRNGRRCHHQSEVPLDALPRKYWTEIAWRFRCVECGSVGYVDLRPDWSELIDFNRPSVR